MIIFPSILRLLQLLIHSPSKSCGHHPCQRAPEFQLFGECVKFETNIPVSVGQYFFLLTSLHMFKSALQEI